MEPPSDTRRRDVLICSALCLFYLFSAITTARDYGITWDEALQDWYVAECNLNYFLTGDRSWVDFSIPRDFSKDGSHPDLIRTYEPHVSIYFGNFISSIGCLVFFKWLHAMGPIEAHHMPNILMTAAIMAMLFFIVRKRFGLLAATAGTMAMAFQPRFWADVHFNTKDVPSACMWAFTMLAARKGILDRKPRWIVIASILLGLAGSTKPLAIMIPVAIAVWYIVSVRGKIDARKSSRAFVASIVASPIIALAAYFASWPYMWDDPIAKYGEYFKWYRFVASGGGRALELPWKTVAMFVACQPPVLLIFSFIGAVLALKAIKKKDDDSETLSFFSLWAMAPIVPFLSPGSHNYDGVRHFIEYAFPLGALFGIGLSRTVSWINSRIANKGKIAVTALLVLAATSWAIPMIQLHPDEIVYFNSLVGGAAGVEKMSGNRGIATDYWGSSYRRGIKWLNSNAEQGAVVVAPVAGGIIASMKEMYMRRDLRLVVTGYLTNAHLADVVRKESGRPIYVIYITRKAFYGDLVKRVDSTAKEAYAIYADGVPILKIMRIDDPTSSGL